MGKCTLQVTDSQGADLTIFPCCLSVGVTWCHTPQRRLECSIILRCTGRGYLLHSQCGHLNIHPYFMIQGDDSQQGTANRPGTIMQPLKISLQYVKLCCLILVYFPWWIILSFMCRMSVASVSSQLPLNTSMFLLRANAFCNFCFISACLYVFKCHQKLTMSSGQVFQFSALVPIHNYQSTWIMSFGPWPPHLMQTGFLSCLNKRKNCIFFFQEGESD